MGTEVSCLALGMAEEQRSEDAGQKPPKPQLLLEEAGPCTNLQTYQPSPPPSYHQSFIPALLPRKYFTARAEPNIAASKGQKL